MNLEVWGIRTGINIFQGTSDHSPRRGEWISVNGDRYRVEQVNYVTDRQTLRVYVERDE